MNKTYFMTMDEDEVRSPSLAEPEEIRKYLKENMAEGYLSEDEGMNIDEFVNEYARLLQVEKNMDEIVKEAIGVQNH